jgi:hypothetical protein
MKAVLLPFEWQGGAATLTHVTAAEIEGHGMLALADRLTERARTACSCVAGFSSFVVCRGMHFDMVRTREQPGLEDGCCRLHMGSGARLPGSLLNGATGPQYYSM